MGDLSAEEVINYRTEFPNLSEKELQKYRALSSSVESFTFTVRYKNRERNRRQQIGVRAIQTHPLVYVLSATLQSDVPVAIYGTIKAEYLRRPQGSVTQQELYSQLRKDAQLVDATVYLPLRGPLYSNTKDHTCIPLRDSRIDLKIELFIIRTDDDLAKDHFANQSCELVVQTEDVGIEEFGYEVVRKQSITCEPGPGVLTLEYVVIPFGVTCCVDISIFPRKPTDEDYSFDVGGRIVVRYANTYGSYTSAGCVLFDKHGEGFEVVNRGESLQLSRCWVALPAYASLLVDMDLVISGINRHKKIVKNTIEFSPQQCGASDDAIVLDDIIISAEASWFPLDYHWPSQLRKGMKMDDRQVEEEIDTKGKDESPDDVLPSNTSLKLSQPSPSPAVEIYSVFIGRDKLIAGLEAQLYGSIDVLSCDVHSIFKGVDKGAFTLSKFKKFIPVLDGSRAYCDFKTLEMKVDIMELKRSLTIKGYGDWETHILDDALCFERQLCSLVRGDHGFAAVHYSVFSRAVEADIKVSLNSKKGLAGDIKVRGSLTAEYSCFDYSSKHNMDCYRIVLFRRSEVDLADLGADCTIPLARSMIVVPSYSSLVFNVDLSFGAFAEELSQGEGIAFVSRVKITIGESVKIVETSDSDYSLSFEVDWHEVK